MHQRFSFPLLAVLALCCLTCANRADEPCPATLRFKQGATSARLSGVTRSGASVFVPLHVSGTKDELRFLFDSGAGRTVIDRNVAARLGLKPTAKSSFGGVGTGRVPVDVVKSATLLFDDARLEGDDLYIADTPEHVAGIIGYDLLCSSVVTLDYQAPSLDINAPSAFHYQGTGDVLPLQFRGRWSYVRGTLKVPGVAAVTDDFLVDTGSDDAVNHPIIRQSKDRKSVV